MCAKGVSMEPHLLKTPLPDKRLARRQFYRPVLWNTSLAAILLFTAGLDWQDPRFWVTYLSLIAVNRFFEKRYYPATPLPARQYVSDRPVCNAGSVGVAAGASPMCVCSMGCRGMEGSAALRESRAIANRIRLHETRPAHPDT